MEEGNSRLLRNLPNFFRTTRRHIPEGSILHRHSRENLGMHKDVFGQEAKLVPQLGSGAPAFQQVPSGFIELWSQIFGGNIILSYYELWR